jgi:hypothetical protein
VKGKKSAATVLQQTNQESSTAWAERMREGTVSPPPEAPEITSHDFAADGEPVVKVERAEQDAEESDHDMEEINIDGVYSRQEGESVRLLDNTTGGPALCSLSSTSSQIIRRTARDGKVRVAVDNPYEESEEDEEKGITCDALVIERTKDESEDSLDEVDFAPVERAPQSTRSGRTIKLRIGNKKEEVHDEGDKRVTRSSKRKR